MEQLVKLAKEMSQVEGNCKVAENHYGSDLLNLVAAKGYLTKLLANAAVKSYIERKEPEILSHFELVANTVSMEDVVQSNKAKRCSVRRGKTEYGGRSTFKYFFASHQIG